MRCHASEITLRTTINQLLNQRRTTAQLKSKRIRFWGLVISEISYLRNAHDRSHDLAVARRRDGAGQPQSRRMRSVVPKRSPGSFWNVPSAAIPARRLLGAPSHLSIWRPAEFSDIVTGSSSRDHRRGSQRACRRSPALGERPLCRLHSGTLALVLVPLAPMTAPARLPMCAGSPPLRARPLSHEPGKGRAAQRTRRRGFERRSGRGSTAFEWRSGRESGR